MSLSYSLNLNSWKVDNLLNAWMRADLFRFSHLTLSKGLEMVKTHVICHMFSNFIDLADVGSLVKMVSKNPSYKLSIGAVLQLVSP